MERTRKMLETPEREKIFVIIFHRKKYSQNISKQINGMHASNLKLFICLLDIVTSITSFDRNISNMRVA